MVHGYLLTADPEIRYVARQEKDGGVNQEREIGGYGILSLSPLLLCRRQTMPCGVGRDSSKLG